VTGNNTVEGRRREKYRGGSECSRDCRMRLPSRGECFGSLGDVSALHSIPSHVHFPRGPGLIVESPGVTHMSGAMGIGCDTPNPGFTYMTILSALWEESLLCRFKVVTQYRYFILPGTVF
jgi:hypothetical protein